MKLRVVLRSDAEHYVYIESAQWLVGPGDVPAASPRWYCFQLQNQLGSNAWQAEDTHVLVRPGGVFRASVALDPALGSEEIRRRLDLQKTGTLALRVRIAHHVSEKHLRL
jgi:hypothetical protein